MRKPRRRAPPPAKPGRALQHLKEFYSSSPSEREDLKIGHVLLLFCDHEKSVAKTIRAFCELLPATCTTANLVKPIIKQFESYKNLARETEKLQFVDFCDKPFTAFSSPEQQEPEESISQPQNPDPVAVQDGTFELGPSSQQTSDSIPGPSGGPRPSPDSVPGPSGVRGPSPRLRVGELTPRKLKLKRRNIFISHQLSTEKKRYQKRIKDLREKVNIQKVNQIKYLNQDIKRKQNSMKQEDANIVLLMKRIKELEKLQQKPAWHHEPNQSEKT